MRWWQDSKVSAVHTLLFTLQCSLQSTDTDQSPICISFPKLQNTREEALFLNKLYIFITFAVSTKKKKRTPNNHRMRFPQETTQKHHRWSPQLSQLTRTAQPANKGLHLHIEFSRSNNRCAW